MLKRLVRKMVVKLLEYEARLVLLKYRPKIVGVVGSLGKTSAKDAIYASLQTGFFVGRSEKSFNSEIGLPLTVLGRDTAWLNPFGWLKNLFSGGWLILAAKSYPEWLVLEIGVDRPGDMRRLIRWLRLDVLVLTRLPEVPAHVEFFSTKEELMAEKLLAIKALKRNGRLIVNIDDPQGLKAAEKAGVPVVSYGFTEAAAVRGSNYHIFYRETAGHRLPDGVIFKVDYAGNTVPLPLRGFVGRHQLFSVLAGIAAAVSQNLNLVSVCERLKSFIPPPGRMRLIEGVKETVIIDDSYNSSPAALAAALETLGSLEGAGRRIAVLADMLELGTFTSEAHREAGRLAARVSDILIAVGVRAKFIAEAAGKTMAKGTIYHFFEADEAGRALQELLRPGDVVIVKGSQAMRLERMVEEVMAHPADKNWLLCRQEAEWQRKV